MFCGAKRPLICYNSSTDDFVYIRGTRKSIGGFGTVKNEQEFIDQEIILNKNYIIFLTSDGYTDQHNHVRKKIGTKQLLEIIKNNVKLDINSQKKILYNYFSEWRQNQIQTDDTTIWAIKI